MAYQNKHIKLAYTQLEILDLERKYMHLLSQLINNSDFHKDLLDMENEISDRYEDYKNIWLTKNKIKIPAERIVYHHIYKNKYFNINKIYTSPVSSDIGLIVNDEVVLCIDVKTNDYIANRHDINSVIVEKNQISFDNKNFSELFTVKSNLDKRMRYTPNYPILTFTLKIVYADDKHKFELLKSNNKFPTLQLACIPNGIISECFDYNIVKGFKNYKYDYNSKHSIMFNDSKELDNYIMNPKNNIHKITQEKDAYMKDGIILWKTTHKKKPYLAINKRSSTMRLITEVLLNRYDSKGEKWEGIKKVVLK